MFFYFNLLITNFNFLILTTFHIHIQGIVQGVGFRPFVYQLALKQGLKGWVNNSNDGVHIEITTTKIIAKQFLQSIFEQLPPLAVVTQHSFNEIEFKEYTSFEIEESNDKTKPKLLLTPDVALCDDCKEELHNPKNRRFQYHFITCTNCGPRYSIIHKLPYDRPNTTMQPFKMCTVCSEEYNNPMERRHFSQTNSCPECKVEIQLFQIPDTKFQNPNPITENFTDIDYLVSQWIQGKIIAIKGIGGYLLTCDATNVQAVETLRIRKHRPTKPFALMYPSIDLLKKDAFVNTFEENELKSIAAPIVLLQTKENLKTNLAYEAINKGLSKIGVMLPYTPLLELLLSNFEKPIIATSANISNAAIIYEDKIAMKELSSIADLILMNNREIMIPQDDGVVQFSQKYHQKIVLRRSRGKAPIYINPNLKTTHQTIFASGGMLKSVFGFLYENNFYISQYLGNTDSYDAQLNYNKTFEHFQNIFNIPFHKVITDIHPDYFATRFGEELAKNEQASLTSIQHHKAHFWSVLGENNLLDTNEPILGIIWDGTGLGEDGNIWGGEFFIFQNKTMDRVYHLDEFPFILGDKMSKEPRISALAVTLQIPESEGFVKPKFTEIEWNIYKKLAQNSTLKSTSMGRIFDAVSSLLFGYDVHSFEAEASTKLENMATQYYYKHKIGIENSYLFFNDFPLNFVTFIIQNIINDIQNGLDKQLIAVKFHLTLVEYIRRVAHKFKIKQLAFSGGVFQNALLVDILIEYLQSDFGLYFHKDFSPNDEGIAFGQLVSLF